MPRPRGRSKPLRPGLSDWGRKRVALELSQRELEARSGINRADISRMENGKLIPGPDQATAILRVFEERQRELEGAAATP